MTTSPDLFRALAVVSEDATPAQAPAAASLGVTPDRAAHTELFSLQLPPYASIYLGAQGMLGGEAAGRVAGFWRALGLVPPAEPDHLAALLGLYAALAEAEAGEPDAARRLLRGEARRALLWEHLLVWVPLYARAAVRSGSVARAGDAAATAGDGAGVYRPWAEALASAVLAEAAANPPAEGFLPLHFREAPPPAAPGEGDLDGDLAHLLAPVRSGMVLTRRDLAHAARSLDLGLRAGERRFVLAALVAQDPPAVFGWLADQAGAWVAEHEHLAGVLGPVAGFWRDRAQGTERRLRRCRHEAQRSPAAATPG